jgi:dipeptidyl aminopeptidase/acylaminoacyl peptidase
MDFDWSPDARAIAFSHQPTPRADDWTRTALSEIEVATGVVKAISATASTESATKYSPGWAADGRLLFRETKRTHSTIFAMPADGPPAVLFEPQSGTSTVARLNARGTLLGLELETTVDPPEAYVMKLGGAPVQVSRANADLPRPALGKTEVIRWKSKDGMEIEGLLTYPANYEKGKRYPLILNIHGGPTGVFAESFIGRGAVYPIAAFASRGYAVLRPNPRGSSGYGKDFRFANYNDWGGRDYEDDQTGVDRVIEMGVADPERLCVMGWSYGGFMTSWTITQTQRFKAAAIGAGVTDLWSFTGTSDIPGFLPDYFGGEPSQQLENFRKHSPITFVKNVNTPTLIIHGEADDRVPPSQDYEYYHALKTRGVTVKMVVYPRQPHGFQEPKFVMDVAQRHLDWVEKYVR